MARRKTPEEAAWLAERYPATPNRELADEFEREFGWRVSPENIACWASSRGLRKAGWIDWRNHPEYVEFMLGFIPGHGEREIADAFEREFGIRLNEGQIGNFKTRFGVRSGTAGGRFERGHEPANKGKTWDEMGIPEDVRERMRATQFKKGHLPHNAYGKPVGFERVNRDGYVEVKVKDGRQAEANDNYRLKHRLVWEEANGRKLRPGEMVVFADGDKRNLDPDNLVAMTTAEHAVIIRAGIAYADRETCETAIRIARVKMAAARAGRRPRRCASCGEMFEPRFERQRRCDRCLGR